MPHCVHILKSAEPECTGILRIVLSLAKHAAPLGYSATILFLGHGPLENEAGNAGIPFGVVRWDGSRKHPAGAWRAWQWLHRQSADVAQVHFGGLAVRAVCRAAGVRTVVQHIHSRILENAKGASVSQLRFFGADAVIASSCAAAQFLRGCHPEVIYAGLETAPLPPAPPACDAPFRLGVLTRLVPLKNVACVIRSVSRLANQGMNLELEIAGSGPSEPELRELAARLGIDRHVRFLGWQPEVRALLARWNLLVIASDEESFPVSALEAMAGARPVLATRAGGLPELVADGVTGRLIPPRDEEAMTLAIAELVSRRDVAEQMGQAGWQRAREDFSPEKRAQQTVQLYERLLGGSHGKHG